MPGREGARPAGHARGSAIGGGQPQPCYPKQDGRFAASATALALLGFPVVRVAPRCKRPLAKGWQAEATTDPAEVASLWAEAPSANIGLACGEAFWALDVDGEEGRATLAGLQARHGRLPATVASRTGSGGFHLLFAPSRRARSSVRRLGPGLDTRAAGGLIVVAPSVHPRGTPYRWVEGREPWALPLAPASRWLLDRLDLPRGEGPIGPIGPSGNAYGRAALRNAVERAGEAQEGRRNATLNAEAFGLGRLVGAGLLRAEVVATALASAALAAGLTRREAERTLASGLRAGVAQPWKADDARA